MIRDDVIFAVLVLLFVGGIFGVLIAGTRMEAGTGGFGLYYTGALTAFAAFLVAWIW